jgi:hypothetical protein
MPWHQRPLLWHLLRRSRFSVEVLSAHTGAREGSQPSFGTPPVSHTGQGVFDKLVQVLVFGYAYWWASERSCSSTTLGHKRDVWIAAGVMDIVDRVGKGDHHREAHPRSLDSLSLERPIFPTVTYSRRPQCLTKLGPWSHDSGTPPPLR